MMDIYEEAQHAHKSYPGYDFTISTARVRPVTGREWVYTATPEQIEVILGVERLFECLINTHYDYVFREVHTDTKDGWQLTILDKQEHKTHTHFYEGFPETAGRVLAEIHKTMRDIREAKEIDRVLDEMDRRVNG